ncbi:MAG: hypothetical protein M3R04_06195 [bacterium]|nr:hypothetical protein [bacterium]
MSGLLEKLDVLRAAVTMGYTKDDLKDLDARLERLVGSDNLKSILDVDKSVQKYEKALQANDLATDQALEALQAARSRIPG